MVYRTDARGVWARRKGRLGRRCSDQEGFKVKERFAVGVHLASATAFAFAEKFNLQKASDSRGLGLV